MKMKSPIAPWTQSFLLSQHKLELALEIEGEPLPYHAPKWECHIASHTRLLGSMVLKSAENKDTPLSWFLQARAAQFSVSIMSQSE